MDKRFMAILAVIVLAFGGFLVLSKKSDDGNGNGSNTVSATNHTYGEGKKGVVLIEYGDFQCPSCGAFFPIVQALKENYKSDITFQFRHFPLTQIHPNAFAAHRAAEAASKQGKFWEMHDKLYENQQVWTNDTAFRTTLEGYAGELGLDMDKFKADYASSEVNDLINADMDEGKKLGIQGTPTFVLDGQVIESPRSLDEFSKLIDEAIAKKSSNPATE